MCERYVVGRVYSNCLCGGVHTAISIRTCNGISASIADSYRIACLAVAPRIRIRARGCKCGVVALAEAVVTGDVHVRRWVNRYSDIRGCRTALCVGGSYSIDSALGNVDAAGRATVTPFITCSTVSCECGSLTLTDGRVARNGWCGQSFHRQGKSQNTVASTHCLQCMRVRARCGKVLSVEVVALALTHAMCERDVVGRVHGNRLRGGIRTAVSIRSRDSIGAGIVHRDGRIGTAVAPRIRVCARGRQRGGVTLTETTVTGDVHVGQRVDCYSDIRGGGAALDIGRQNSIDAALRNGYARTGNPVAPDVGNTAVGCECGGLVLADDGVAEDRGCGIGRDSDHFGEKRRATRWQ